MKALTRVAMLMGVVLGSVSYGHSADVELTGKVRFYLVAGFVGVQVDVVNDSRDRAAFGPNVSVRIKDRHNNVLTEQSGLKLYQYFGGTATAPNTVNPHEMGYIPLKLSPTTQLVNGEELRVKISGEGASNFGSDSRNAVACKKGLPGCP